MNLNKTRVKRKSDKSIKNITQCTTALTQPVQSCDRLVHSVKWVLDDILVSSRVTEDVSGTIQCLFEQALNARPTTPLITDLRDLEALTYNHIFLFCSFSFVLRATFPSPSPGEYFDHKKVCIRAQS